MLFLTAWLQTYIAAAFLYGCRCQYRKRWQEKKSWNREVPPKHHWNCKEKLDAKLLAAWISRYRCSTPSASTCSTARTRTFKKSDWRRNVGTTLPTAESVRSSMKQHELNIYYIVNSDRTAPKVHCCSCSIQLQMTTSKTLAGEKS